MDNNNRQNMTSINWLSSINLTLSITLINKGFAQKKVFTHLTKIKEKKGEKMNNLEEKNNLLIYKNKEGTIIVDAIYKDETLWLTQKAMSKVFDCSTDNISLRLKNIFKDKELDENSAAEEFSITAFDGKKYYIRKDVIICG